VRQLIESGPFAHLVTINADGRPQVTIVWIGIEDDEIVVGHLFRHRKAENVLRDPRVAISLEAEAANAIGMRDYAVVYGQARITEGGAPELLQRLARTYVGADATFPSMPDPPPGYVTRIRSSASRDRAPGPRATDGAPEKENTEPVAPSSTTPTSFPPGLAASRTTHRRGFDLEVLRARCVSNLCGRPARGNPACRAMRGRSGRILCCRPGGRATAGQQCRESAAHVQFSRSRRHPHGARAGRCSGPVCAAATDARARRWARGSAEAPTPGRREARGTRPGTGPREKSSSARAVNRAALTRAPVSRARRTEASVPRRKRCRLRSGLRLLGSARPRQERHRTRRAVRDEQLQTILEIRHL
jgi:PPOX class probable F420-dependent enzyme